MAQASLSTGSRSHLLHAVVVNSQLLAAVKEELRSNIDTCVTLAPYFKVHKGRLAAFRGKRALSHNYSHCILVGMYNPAGRHYTSWPDFDYLMGILMKIVFVTAFILLAAVSYVPAVMAGTSQENQVKADKYYRQGNFNKAYKYYLQSAKKGDHYSQDRISSMYANGEGQSPDLTQAYAWSVLAAESGEENMMNSSEALLQRINDPARAQDSAEKLKEKYGKDVLEEKAETLARREKQRDSGSCTGTHLACRNH